MTARTAGPTIVVGYDGSPAARAAVDYAIGRAGPAGRLVVVLAYHVPADYVGAGAYSYMLEETSAYAEQVMEDLVRDCEALAAVQYERDLVVGAPAEAIIRAAEVHEADEIVMGSRGLGRVRALVGSVAHDVLHHAHCPVTVIPERMVQRRAAPAAAAAA